MEEAAVLDSELVSLRQEVQADHDALGLQKEARTKLLERRAQLEAKLKEAKARKVIEDPIEVDRSRQKAQQSLQEHEERLLDKKSQLSELQTKVASLTKLISERKSQLDLIKRAQLIKQQKKKQKEEVRQANSNLEKIRSETEFFEREVKDLQTMSNAQEQQDIQFQDYHQ